jgi:EmrB/QacA subfamily drug resistance transporter
MNHAGNYCGCMSTVPDAVYVGGRDAAAMSVTPQRAVTDGSGSGDARHERLTLFAMCFGLFMIMLDNTIVNVALPSIQRDLHASPETLAWTVNAYVVPFAALILLGGKLGDRFGRRRMFVVGVAVFTAASAACAVSTTAGALVASRTVQGAGAALMNPLSLSILVATFPRERLPAAIGVWAGISGLGLAIGPLLGGVLVENVSWSAVFWINVPIGVLAMAVTLRAVRESRDATGRSLDIPGAALVTSALFCVVWGLIKSDSHGFGSVYVVGFLLTGLVLGILFVGRERRAVDPMLPLSFFARRLFSVSDAVMLLVGFAMFGAIYYGALYLQNVQGYSALQAGLRTLPWTLMILVVAPIAGRVNSRIGARMPAAVGMLLVALGLIGLARLSATSAYSSIWPAFVLCGVGTALAMPTVSAAAMSAIASDKAGVGSGVLNTARQVGGALGIAVLGAVATGRIGARWDQFVAAVPPGLRIQAAHLAPLVDGGQLRLIGRLAGPIATQAASSAFMTGFHTAMWTAAALCLAAAVVAFVGLAPARTTARPSVAPA